MRRIIEVGIALLAVVGFAGAGQIAWDHLSGAAACPMLELLPACYLITAGYGAVLLSLVVKHRAALLFWIGIVPVFLLALAGSVAEVTATAHCPHTSGGVPKCYFSLVLSGAIILFGYFLHCRISRI